MARGTRTTLRNKLLFFFLFFASVPILAFSFWTMQALNLHAEKSVLSSLEGLVKTKAQAIETFSQNRVSTVENLSNLSSIVANVRILVNQGEDQASASADEAAPLSLEQEGGGLAQSIEETHQKRAKRRQSAAGEVATEDTPVAETKREMGPVAKEAFEDLNTTLNVILADQEEFEELLIIDPDGLVLASTYEGHEGKTAKGINYFQKGLRATYFQHVFVSSITGNLTMVIATPIKEETGNVLGVFAARLNLDLFFDFVGDLAGLRRTGETIVAKEVGDKIVFMAPTRHDPNAALNRTIEVGSNVLKPLQEAARGASGVGAVVDYRGERALAAWAHIPSLDWGIMVKIDRDEAVGPYMTAQYKTIILTIVLLFVAVLLALYVANALVKPIRVLQEAADRISKGDLDVKIAIFSRDEIGDLADSFGRMIASIKFLLEEKDRNPEQKP